ncbi:sulfotransferase family protein [Roseovarius aestuariivivens]|uniref:sulfotransferase family protein n=1 Tax=Roseovarius aestuariivivens TaxID=1888910 RepID=UPI001436C956|nr:sulfotransferase [Roseovarius aestuariivivens]
MDALCREAPAGPARTAGKDEPRLVFICGLPRSGTTLVESILAQHPQAESLGESPALARLTDRARASDAPDDRDLRAQNLAMHMARRTTPPPQVLIDKTPLNLFELGLARRLFPDARIIFLSRHPLDTGLSNFTTNFHAAHPFSHRLDTIGHMTRAAYRAAAHYATALGPAFRRQSFRALVTSPEPQIRALLMHVGLDWDSACLSPERRAGIVGTASLTQVRAPISTGALNKWTPYRTQLQPLIDALGGWNWIEDWARADSA